MNQDMPQGFGDFTDFSERQPQGSNPLGVIGFVLAFCVSPVGLILSLVALAKQPRGFAIAGVVVGLLGTGVLGCLGFSVYFANKTGMMQAMQVVSVYQLVHTEVEAFRQQNQGEVPPDLATLSGLMTIPPDPWGRAFVYEADASRTGFTFSSAGADGAFGTNDDIVIHSSEAPDVVGQRLMQEAMGRSGIGQPQRGTFPAPPPAPAPAPSPPPVPAEQGEAESGGADSE